MKSIQKYLFVYSILFIFGCNNEPVIKNSDSIRKDSLTKNSPEHLLSRSDSGTHEILEMRLPPDTIYIHRDSVIYKENKMVVLTTCLNAQVDLDEMHKFNPIILKQEFIFMNNETIISKRELPVKKIYQKISSGKKQKMLENVITEIGVVVGKKGVLYTVQGYGGCNACSESCGLISVTGEISWFYCGTRGSNIEFDIGDETKALLRTGIPDSIYENHIYHSIDIYPPLCPW